MINALWITLIGMGLVFIAILLLWGMMALLVRLTADRASADKEPAVEEAAAAPVTETEPETDAVSDAAAERDRKRRAAAAAVAVALSLQTVKAPARAEKGAGSLSAWQMVHRAGHASHRASSRKKVVR